MNILRRATGLTVALSVIGVMPGLDFYHAAAQSFRSTGRVAVSGNSVVPISFGSRGSVSNLVPSASLPSLSGSLKSFSTPKLAPSALPGSECPGSGRLVGDDAPAPSDAPRENEGRGQSGNSGESRETPAPQDRPERWDREWRKGGDALLEPASSAPELSVEKITDMPASSARANGHAIIDWLMGRETTLKKGSRQTPDPDGSGDERGKGSPDNEEVDDLGNPPRRQSPGPDDTTDDIDRGGDRGGSPVFFKSPVPTWAGATAAPGSDFRLSLKKGSRKTPDPDGSGSGDGRGQGSPDNEPVDDLGNPPRRQSPGPDDTTDDIDRGGDRGGGSPVLFGASVLAWTGLAASMGVAGLLAVHFLMIVPSLILHEMAHAKVADLLGDPTPRLEGRLGWRPKDLLTHLDATGIILIPVALILAAKGIGAWARPVEPEPANFKHPVRDTALTALAGPATHVLLTIAGAGVFWGLSALGVGGAVLAASALFVFVNAALAMLNLMPVFPFDGHHILRALLPAKAATALDSFYESHPILRWIPTILVLALLGGVVLSAAGAVAGALIGPASAASLLGGLGG